MIIIVVIIIVMTLSKRGVTVLHGTLRPVYSVGEPAAVLHLLLTNEARALYTVHGIADC